jgi:hypothetical protein
MQRCFHSLAEPPGCSAWKHDTSYTFECTTIQQSFSWLCFLISSHETTLGLIDTAWDTMINSDALTNSFDSRVLEVHYFAHLPTRSLLSSTSTLFPFHVAHSPLVALRRCSVASLVFSHPCLCISEPRRHLKTLGSGYGRRSATQSAKFRLDPYQTTCSVNL